MAVQMVSLEENYGGLVPPAWDHLIIKSGKKADLQDTHSGPFFEFTLGKQKYCRLF
jgi:hypothetical protein